MKLSERSIKIKELINGQVDMGTFGLIELELIEFDKELAELKKLRVTDVSGRSEELPESEKLCRMNQNFVCNCIDEGKCPNF